MMADVRDADFAAWMVTSYSTLLAYRELPAGRYSAVVRKLFHWSLITGELGDRDGLLDQWCYDGDEAPVLAAWRAWAGEGEPEGWQRHPTTGRRRPGGDKNKEYIAW